MVSRWKSAIRDLKNNTVALYYAYRDPRTPWYAKVFCAYVVIRTISPIDLIPDFIPVLGYLDDLILTPIYLWLAIKMIPADVMEDARQQAADKASVSSPAVRWYILLVICIWVLILVLLLKPVVPLVISLINR